MSAEAGQAWVTLATNDSYALGAIVLARSLLRTNTTRQLVVMITPGVSRQMRDVLESEFNTVLEVNVLDSEDAANLALLSRPELGITFTKLHCWRLTQFTKCVFLDADTLVLQACDELFDRDEFSAAPDSGWPDCFNSGVFVFKPSLETYTKLLEFAVSTGSFDGGDQGLLNLYFSDWSVSDISRHLPFTYNVCASATYSYLPAYRVFGQNAKIVHFLGQGNKPWLQYFDTATGSVRAPEGQPHLQELLQAWWDIFRSDVHPKLTPEMDNESATMVEQVQSSLSHVFTPAPQYNYPPHPPHFFPQPEPIHHHQVTPPEEPPHIEPPQSPPPPPPPHYDLIGILPPEFSQLHVAIQRSPPENVILAAIQRTLAQQHVESVQSHNTPHHFETNSPNPPHVHHNNDNSSAHDHHHHHNDNRSAHEHHHHNDNRSTHDHHHHHHNDNRSTHDHHEHHNENDHHHHHHNENRSTHDHHEHHNDNRSTHDHHEHHNDNRSTQDHHHGHHHSENSNCESAPSGENAHVHNTPTSSDNISKSHFAAENETIMDSMNTHSDDSTVVHHVDVDDDESAKGLAGAFAKMSLEGQKTAEQIEQEEQMRKHAWEQGHIDYMGKDSFDNILKKIQASMEQARLSTETARGKSPTPPTAPATTPQPEPVITAAAEEVLPEPEATRSAGPQEVSMAAPLSPGISMVSEMFASSPVVTAVADLSAESSPDVQTVAETVDSGPPPEITVATDIVTLSEVESATVATSASAETSTPSEVVPQASVAEPELTAQTAATVDSPSAETVDVAETAPPTEAPAVDSTPVIADTVPTPEIASSIDTAAEVEVKPTVEETVPPPETAPAVETAPPVESAPQADTTPLPADSVGPAETAPPKESAPPAETAPQTELAPPAETAPKTESAPPADTAPLAESTAPAETQPAESSPPTETALPPVDSAPPTETVPPLVESPPITEAETAPLPVEPVPPAETAPPPAELAPPAESAPPAETAQPTAEPTVPAEETVPPAETVAVLEATAPVAETVPAAAETVPSSETAPTAVETPVQTPIVETTPPTPTVEEASPELASTPAEKSADDLEEERLALERQALEKKLAEQKKIAEQKLEEEKKALALAEAAEASGKSAEAVSAPEPVSSASDVPKAPPRKQSKVAAVVSWNLRKLGCVGIGCVFILALAMYTSAWLPTKNSSSLH